MTKPILIRKMPEEMLREIDALAARDAGASGRPSRPATILRLIERGLADATRSRRAVTKDDATVRGESAESVDATTRRS